VQNPSIPKPWFFNFRFTTVLISLWFIIIPDISIWKKDRENIHGVSKRKNINLTHLQKEVLGDQVAENKGLTLSFARAIEQELWSLVC
jgi:hypothetical protein